MIKPRHPIFVPSKGRYSRCLTANRLIEDDVEFKIVIEEQEFDFYRQVYDENILLILPFRDKGLFSARNWIKEHSITNGDEMHWQIDDNIRHFFRRYRGRRIPCNANIGLAVTEKFVDRYENIAIAGLTYDTFAPNTQKIPPFHLNCHVYSCTLINNAIPHKWRLLYNDDTDLCLQVLADGWCTVTINVFLAGKVQTMTVRGGNTDDLYGGDGRLRMARQLERVWPKVVQTKRRFKRPQHVIHNQWKYFDTPLKRKPNVEIKDGVDEFGIELNQVAPEIKSKTLQEFYEKERTNAT